MIYVYVLRSLISDRQYIGLTNDVDRRLREHNGGKMKYTKAYRPWEVVYQESCLDYSSARRREKYLKSGGGRRFLKHLFSEEEE